MQAGQLVLSSSKQHQPRMCGYVLKLMICSFSGLRSSLLRPDCYSTFVLAWICTDDTGFSPASKGSSMLSQSKHWSDGRRVCRTCSAALELKKSVWLQYKDPAKSGNIAVTYIEKWLDIQQLIGWIIYLCEMCTTLPDKLFRLYSAEHETTLLATLMQSYINLAHLNQIITVSDVLLWYLWCYKHS